MHCRLTMLLIVGLFTSGFVPWDDQRGLLGSGIAAASELEAIRYDDLKDQIGDSLPTGAGITVAQIEVNTSKTGLTYTPQTDGLYENEFLGKTFDYVSGASDNSLHASRVAQRFYGNLSSVAPGIDTIVNYNATQAEQPGGGWLYDDFLHHYTTTLPEVTPTRVYNHSWLIEMGSNFRNKDVLHRIDWMVETDDVISVNGVQNTSTPGGPYPVFASSFNSIAVGLTNGKHISGAPSIGTPYSGGRTRPHLVAPTIVSSFAAPLVAGTSAMLIETAQTRPWLSNGTILSSVGRNNWNLNHGETSEVMRSLLMAGAARQANFVENNVAREYQVTTTSGLDSHFGAGQLDVFNSYHILAAGEQDSIEAGGSEPIKLYGFDYEPSITPNTTKTYRFSIDEVEREFVASLNWNLAIEMNLLPDRYRGTPELSLGSMPNLDLKLVEIIGSGSQEVLASTDTIDTTENLYVAELPAGDYEIQVSFDNSMISSIDYGLAWRFAPSDEPLAGDVNLDGLVSLLDTAIIQGNMGETERVVWTDGDLDGDGSVSRSDLTIALNAYGSGASTAQPPVSSSSVPEPSSLALIVIGLFCVSGLRSRGARIWRIS